MKKNKKIKFWLLGIAAFLIAVVFCLWPTQYYIEAPGEAFQISKYVKSTRKPNPNFYLVTVSERPAVMIDYLTSFLRPGDSRYSKTELMGTSSSTEYNQMQQYYMETSQNNAIYYAAKKAKVPYRQEFLGVYVMEVMKNSTFRRS
jgi:PDZ domain-containing protein